MTAVSESVGVGTSADSDLVLEVTDLQVRFGGRRAQKPIRAIDWLSFTMASGETVGVIGESGSGKSTMGRAVLGLTTPTSGSIRVGGDDLWARRGDDRRRLRRRVQGIFQDPHEALDPRMTVAQSITEPLRRGVGMSKAAADLRAVELLEMVGLGAFHLGRRPHELSGGQKQRVNIARALTLNPELIVCDEIVSALDVSIQADILNLLADIQSERSVSYLFISHDLAVVSYLADRVIVMYLGIIVEEAAIDTLIADPRHPYTRALVAAQSLPLPPSLRPAVPPPLQGDIPSPADPPSGCRFRTRCPYAQPICAEQVPATVLVGDRHTAACHFTTEIATGELARTDLPNPTALS